MLDTLEAYGSHVCVCVCLTLFYQYLDERKKVFAENCYKQA